MRIRRVAVLAGALLALALAGACDAAGDGPPVGQTLTPTPIVTVSPAPKPGPDSPVSSTPGPLATATVIPISETPVAEAGRTLVLAPIESVQVAGTKTPPARYVLTVGSGLPGGCARYAGATVEYRDTQVIVKVYNSMPAAPVPCTANLRLHHP